jgi:hypothetical protein
MKIARLCAVCAQLCAARAQHCATCAQLCATCARLCANCAQLCAVITLLVIFNVLAYFLISPLVNYNVLVSRGTHRRTELAAENPKNKNKF